MSEFTLFLLKISKEIENKDLNTMKICCSNYDIGAQRLEKITEAYELFKELERRDQLGPENTGVLVNLLEQAGRIDLKNRVLERSTRGESQLSVPDGPVRNNILKDTRLNDISEDLSRDWKQLGRKLGISNNIIDNIDDENRRVKDKSVQMLLKWKRQSGNDATGEVLANALIAIGRRDVAETLANKCRQDGIIIHISEEGARNATIHGTSRTESGGLYTMQADLAPRLPTQESQ